MPTKATLTFGDRSNYIPEALQIRTEAELRKEYTKLRDIAEKRIKSLAASEFKTSEVYQQNKAGFPKLANIKTEAQLRHELNKLAYFVSAKTSSVSGQRAKRRAQIQTFKEHGYNFVNQNNYNMVVEFFDEMKELLGTRGGSPTPEELETFVIARQKGIKAKDLQKDFEFWIDHRKDLKKLDLPEGKRHTSANYRKALQGKL